jgi:hypothetical protein
MAKRQLTATEQSEAQRLLADSQDFAEKATRLTELLTRAQLFLYELPGKMPVSVKDDEFSLSFAKNDGVWGIYIQRHNSTKAILATGASIALKAEAAQLLPELYDAIQANYKESREAVDAGLRSLEKLPWLHTESSDNERRVSDEK